MSRPTKYDEKLQKKFDELVDKLYTSNRVLNYSQYWEYGSLANLAVYLSINIDTIYDWKDEKSERFKKEFSETYKKYDTKKKALLHNITPTIAELSAGLSVFLRKAQLGEHETLEVTGRGGAALPHPVNIFNQKIDVEITREDFAKLIEHCEAMGLPREEIEEAKQLRDETFTTDVEDNGQEGEGE